MSPTDDPVIDKHPGHQNIIIASGFSGNSLAKKQKPFTYTHLIELILVSTCNL